MVQRFEGPVVISPRCDCSSEQQVQVNKCIHGGETAYDIIIITVCCV